MTYEVPKFVKIIDLGVAGALAISRIEPAFCLCAESREAVVLKVQRTMESYRKLFVKHDRLETKSDGNNHI
jgi:hypothetical protein